MHKLKYDIVLADADETIFDFKKAEETAFLNTLNFFDKTCTHQEYLEYSKINLRLWSELELGLVDRDVLKTKRFDEWFTLKGFQLDSSEFDSEYVKNLSRCDFLIDGAYDFLEKLSKLCDVYIVTNGLKKSQTGRFNRSSIKTFINKMYISEEIGFSKPDRRYFDYCINDIGVADRSRYIILGDSLSSDMQGGRNAGIDTCRFVRDTNFEHSGLCDYEITDYNSFFQIICK